MPIDQRLPIRDLPSTALMPFFIIAFSITWGLIGFYIFFPGQAVSTFGEISGSHPFYFLATWSPAISAFVVLFAYTGISGMRRFLSRLLLWRCSAGWATFILIGLPLVFVAGSLIKGGPMLAPLPADGMGPVVAIMFMMFFHWQLINPFWPDAQPWDTWILVAAALIVVWLNRASMFNRRGMVTQVIPSTGGVRS